MDMAATTTAAEPESSVDEELIPVRAERLRTAPCVHDHNAGLTRWRALVLQRHFTPEGVTGPPAVVAAAGLRLPLAPPARPVQPEGAAVGRVGQHAQQPPDRRRGERDPAVRDRRPLSPTPALAVARVTSRKACASRQRVMCRYHPCHFRTSYWSSPTSPLARSKPSSITQRVPATRAISARVVMAGAKTR